MNLFWTKKKILSCEVKGFFQAVWGKRQKAKGKRLLFSLSYLRRLGEKMAGSKPPARPHGILPRSKSPRADGIASVGWARSVGSRDGWISGWPGNIGWIGVIRR